MGWFSRKPQGQAFPFAVSLVHAASDHAAAWWPQFGLSDAPGRMARHGELQVYALALGSSLVAMNSIRESAAREIISTTHIVLQGLSLRARPSDFATPQRAMLAIELREVVVPAIDGLSLEDPSFAQAFGANVFAEHSVDDLLSSVNAFGAWIGRTGDAAPGLIGQFFGERNDNFRTPVTDMSAMRMMSAMIAKAEGMASAYRW